MTYNKDKSQFDFKILPEGRALGLTSSDVGMQLRSAFYGDLAMRQLRQTNEIEVRVKLPHEERKDLYNLEDLVIYALLATAFKNYAQPLIVMGAIPFGIVGAVIGHILLGYDLSLVSLIGVIALSGVVVNDSLIMIDYANKKRNEQSTFDAIHDAGIRRFRPIMLTTFTTFGGLTAIILETSKQATYLIPMAISLGLGIVFTTAIILVILPSMYMILEDVAKKVKPA